MLGLRYAKLRDALKQSIVEEEAEASELPSELEIQAQWFAGNFGREFQSTEGESVKVIQFGEWNHGAGPDFTRAVVDIDGVKKYGAVEIDRNFSSWKSHKHEENPNYNSVVLHVTFSKEAQKKFTKTQIGNYVPRIELTYKKQFQAANLPASGLVIGRCKTPLLRMEPERITNLLKEAAIFRAAEKAKDLTRLENIHGKREALWQMLGQVLGYHKNQLPMQVLTQKIPLKKLLETDDEEEQAALLFGHAGFLTAELHEKAQPESREYLQTLWQKWWKHRTQERALSLPWTLSGIRPANHPQRRVGTLLALTKNWKPIYQKATPTSLSVFQNLKKILAELDDQFWSRHYTLSSKETARPVALFGQERVKDFLVNVILPSVIQQDSELGWKIYAKIKAKKASDRVERATHRLFGNREDKAEFTRFEWQHQALLQIYRDFCLQDKSDCEECPFPEQLANWQ